MTGDGGIGVRSPAWSTARPGGSSINRTARRQREQGYVEMPNVNVVEEMTNMISASRAYQTNAEVMNAKSLLLKTLASPSNRSASMTSTTAVADPRQSPRISPASTAGDRRIRLETQRSRRTAF